MTATLLAPSTSDTLALSELQSHKAMRPVAPTYKRDGSRAIDMVLPAFARSITPKRGMRMIDFAGLGISPGFGGGAASSGGYNASADILTSLADGTPLNDLWDEFQRTITLTNEPRDRFINFLTFSVTDNVETVLQSGGQTDFERATEYGEPVGMRTKLSYWQMGYDFDWYDLAARFTWQFLADATANQVQALAAQALEADNRNVFTKVMKTVFNSTNLTATINQNAYNVYKFWNGVAVGTVAPPPYKNNTFTTTHNHYLGSGATLLDSGDLETMQTSLNEHGYSVANGYQLILMVNPASANVIRAFRFGVVNNNSVTANFDFIPSLGQPDFTLSTTQTIVGTRLPAFFNGFTVLGSYGDWMIIQDDYIPTGYMFGFATGGADNLNNPIGIRQHANAQLRGLRLVKGRTADYPLIDSFYQRGFGTGVRQRSAGVVMQIVNSGTYTIPTIYA